MKTKTKKKTDFRKWLTDKGLTTEAFAQKAGLHMSTVDKWAYTGAAPREAYADKVKKAFPDCPLVA